MHDFLVVLRESKERCHVTVSLLPRCLYLSQLECNFKPEADVGTGDAECSCMSLCQLWIPVTASAKRQSGFLTSETLLPHGDPPCSPTTLNPGSSSLFSVSKIMSVHNFYVS